MTLLLIYTVYLQLIYAFSNNKLFREQCIVKVINDDLYEEPAFNSKGNNSWANTVV